MALERIKTDGSETGQTAADKINAAISAIEAGSGVNMTPKLGVNINDIIGTGYYMVDTNLPTSASVGELRVGVNTEDQSVIIQEYIDSEEPIVLRRQSVDTGASWSPWMDTPQTIFNKRHDELHFYEFSKVQGASTTSDTWVQLNELIVTPPEGTYMLQFNALFSYDSTGRSAFFRASDDGGATWVEIRKEAKDTTDTNSYDYSYPYIHTGGSIHLIVEYKTENANDTLSVHGSNLVVERKR